MIFAPKYNLATSETCLSYVFCLGIRHSGPLRNLSGICASPRDWTLRALQKFVSYTSSTWGLDSLVTPETCLGYVFCSQAEHLRHLRNLSQIRVFLEEFTFWAPEELVSDMCFAQGLATVGTSETCLGHMFCKGIEQFGHLRNLSRIRVLPGN